MQFNQGPPPPPPPPKKKGRREHVHNGTYLQPVGQNSNVLYLEPLYKAKSLQAGSTIYVKLLWAQEFHYGHNKWHAQLAIHVHACIQHCQEYTLGSAKFSTV